MSMKHILPGFLALVMMTTSPPKTESAEIEKITSIEGFTEYRLENGMRVLLYPDDSKPVVTVNNTIFVGSRHEGYGEAGMAHLLEHMLFKGTPTFPQVPKVLQDRGAQFNGTTWVDRTNYYETLPASDENLEFAIQLEADRMMNSFVKGEDLVSEMTVVRNEFERGENSPSRVLGQRMMATAFEWHNYGQTTIGNRADIERVPVESLRQFYKKYYQPDNAMVIIAGKFEPETALKLVEKYFGAIPKPTRKLPATYTEEPAQDGERLVTLRRVGEVPLVGLVYHICSGAHPDYVALDVLENICTSSPTGRLYKALVETKKASSVSGVAFSWHDPGVLRIIAQVSEGVSTQNVLDTMLDELTIIQKKGVTKEEVERAQSYFLKQIELAQTDSRRMALQMSEWAAQGDWRLFFLYRDRVEKVTPDDVQRVAKKYLPASNRTVGMFLPTEKPERASVPATPDLAKMIGDYKGREVVAAGEAFDVHPKNIEERTTRTKLASGLSATLLPKKTRGGLVNIRMNLRFGNLENLQNLSRACDFLGPLMSRGTEKLTREQIQDTLDKYRARISATSGAGYLRFTVQAKEENLKEVMAILKQIAREPTLPVAELDVLKNGQLSSLKQQLPDPTALAMKKVTRKLNDYPKGDPRYTMTMEEEIAATEAVSREVLQDLYTNYLGGTDGEVAVIGDFDVEEMTTMLNDLLADWKAKKPFKLISRDFDGKFTGGKDRILTPDKENAIYFAGTLLKMGDTNPDYPALLMGNYILGAGSLSSRLGDRVRQKEGLSYGVASQLRVSPLDERGTFTIYAICNPENAPKVVGVIDEEVRNLIKDGVTEAELEKAKTGYLQSEEVDRTSDSTLGQLLTTTALTDRTMLYYAEREQAIQELTVEQVNAALKKWLNPDKLYIVIGGDFEKKKEE